MNRSYHLKLASGRIFRNAYCVHPPSLNSHLYTCFIVMTPLDIISLPHGTRCSFFVGNVRHRSMVIRSGEYCISVYSSSNRSDENKNIVFNDVAFKRGSSRNKFYRFLKDLPIDMSDLYPNRLHCNGCKYIFEYLCRHKDILKNFTDNFKW